VKQKKQLAVLVVLMLVAAGVWIWEFRSNNSGTVSDRFAEIKNDPVLNVENPQIRLDEIGKARKTEYNSGGRNIFSLTAALSPASVQHQYLAPADPPKVWNTPCGLYGPCKEVVPPPPPPLVLPPNVKFFGYGVVPNGTARRAFFSDGEQVYVVSEGEILLNRFRILKIGNNNIEFEEISTGRIGTAPLEEQSASPGGGPP
jgi:hypothetical protein